ncbi:exonuclease domain-containing protein [Frigidibacter oleivorans]|uniref:exonuclease domain-containing protein n=1 Tax=Frigidibacter oleivorans TaxID=2487129 RepID=UPI000F8F21F8|nr:exonuclease domain-containing protein [Frigidibacter oleivorans]
MSGAPGLARLNLRLRIGLFFAALCLGGWAAVAAGLWLGFRHLDQAALPGVVQAPFIRAAFVQVGVVAGVGILALTAGIWFLFDEHVARAVERLAGGLRARAHAPVGPALDRETAPYLGDLAPAAQAVTLTLAETRDALAFAVARETARLADEKARLEALLADVPVAVLLCTAGHQLVFYNGPATEILGGGMPPGLDRSIFDHLREAPLRQAHARLLAARDPDASADLICATVAGGRVLAGRMRLVESGTVDGADGGGYALTLRDVTQDFAHHAERERLLDDIFDRIRRPAAALQIEAALLDEGGAARAAAIAAIADEGQRLSAALTDLAARRETQRGGWWPLAFVRASDIADTLQAAFAAEGLDLRTEAEPLVLRCDAFQIVALLTGLARRIAADTGARRFTAALTADGAGAMLRLLWPGAPLPVGRLDRWLEAELEIGTAEFTGRSVLALHGTECWPEPAASGQAALCLPLPEARRAHGRPAPLPRAVVYDFDLLARAPAAGAADRPLSELTYVVFDTETTGLLPQQGDEMVQLAALRIVNGRRVEGEVLDMLVDPGRPIPALSTEVHGITEAMVAGAPGPAEAVRRFRRFAEGAVLVAHNAPFDMEFLRRRAETAGTLDNPVLDTVLLSAVVFGQAETHSLDALAHRLGIVIPEEARHTALGDALATAEALLRLIPMLKARGIATFAEVLVEMRKHGRLLRDLNG